MTDCRAAHVACIATMLAVSAAMADTPSPLATLHATAREDFADLPDWTVLPDISDRCGGGVTGGAVYCTSERTIFLDQATASSDGAPYLLAHLLGHGLQVEYGIADLALAAIGARPDRESALRGMVERQNDCFAGMMLARAGLPLPDLEALFPQDPLAGAHWGRNPVRNGPALRVALTDRAEWLARGHDAAEPGGCSVGEVPADLIVAADHSAR